MGNVYVGIHSDRLSVMGSGSVPGSNVLNLVSGGPFLASWVGSTIVIGTTLVTVTSFTGGGTPSITFSGATIAPGTYSFEFNFLSPNISDVYKETDRKVDYVAKDSFGTCNLNHNQISRVTGPLFTKYWISLPIIVNGSSYTIADATPTAITLSADSGVIMNSANWSTPGGSWYYQNGVETLSLATLQARTLTPSDDQYSVFVYDFGHTFSYNGTSGQWGWGISDSGSNYAVVGNGGPPKGGVWANCNGASTTVLDLVAGVPTAVSVTAPTISGSYLRR